MFVFLPTKNDKKEPLERSSHPLGGVNIPSFEKFEALGQKHKLTEYCQCVFVLPPFLCEFKS